jgi:hypothetical protein
MDIGSGKEYPSGALSNFTPHKFTFRGVECNSMEGLLQSFKFKNPEMQKEVCKLVGRMAKAKGRDKNWKTTQTLWWDGLPIKRDSVEYQLLLDEAYESMARDSESFRKALLASQNAVLTHSIGKSSSKDTVLTVREFCSRLTKLRTKLQNQQKGLEF